MFHCFALLCIIIYIDVDAWLIKATEHVYPYFPLMLIGALYVYVPKWTARRNIDMPGKEAFF